MDLPEGEKLDSIAIIEALGSRKELHGIGDNNNVSERNDARKDFMSSTVKTIAENFIQQLNDGLGLSNGQNILLIDFSKLEIFKEDEEKKSKIHLTNVNAYTRQFALGGIKYGALLTALGQIDIKTPYEDKFIYECPAEIKDLYSNINNVQNQNQNGN